MVTLTADVTEGIREMVSNLVKKGIYKSQSEVVRDAIRQLSFKYGVGTSSLNEIRNITKKAVRKGKKSLAETTQKMREDV